MTESADLLRGLRAAFAEPPLTFERVQDAVGAVPEQDVEPAREFLRELGKQAGQGAAPHLALCLLMARAGVPEAAVGAVIKVVRDYPADAAKLRASDDPAAIAAVRMAEPVLRAQNDVERILKSRATSSPREMLVNLRQIIGEQPLFHRAQIEYLVLCQRELLADEAEQLYTEASLFPVPMPRLELCTLRVAVATVRVQRAVELAARAAERGLDPVSDLRAMAQQYPELRLALRENLGKFRGSGASGAALKACMTALSSPLKFTPASRATPPAIVQWAYRLSNQDAVAAGQSLAFERAAGTPDVWLKRVALACRLGEHAKARAWLPGRAQPSDPYVSLGRKLVAGATPLTLGYVVAQATGAPSVASDPAKDRAAPLDAAADGAARKSQWAAHIGQLAVQVASGEYPPHWRELCLELSVPVEDHLATQLLRYAGTLSLRSSGITDVIEHRMRALASDKRGRPNFRVTHAMVQLHLLTGVAESSNNRDRDRIGRELQHASSRTQTEALANQYMREGFSPALWDAVRSLGDLGYRLEQFPQVARGFLCQRLVNVAAARASGAPERLTFLVVWDDAPQVVEAVKDSLALVARERGVVAALVAVHAGSAGFRVQTYTTEVTRYAAACAELKELSGDGLVGALARAEEAADTVPNPVSNFPFRAQDLTAEQLVPRPEVISSLQAALEAQRLPLTIYCMRKSGKTATARLLDVERPQQIIDLRRYLSAVAERPREVLAELEAAMPEPSRRRGLLVLDEFDAFSRQLALQSESVAMDFLNWLSDAGGRARVLCLGLDPHAFRNLYPASNPLQELPDFRLPYFNRAESLALAARMAGVLKLEPDLLEWICAQSGGHPGVMRALMAWCFDRRFGAKRQRIPTRQPFALEHLPRAELFSEAGFHARELALGTIVNTLSDARGVSLAAWQVLSYVVAPQPQPQPRLAIINEAAALDLGLKSGAAEAFELLLSWGLLKCDAADQVVISVPLLRYHLRSQQKLEPET